MIVIATIGAKSLFLLYIWLASAIGASWLSERKGYGEKAGLVTGLIVSALALVIWLLWPAKPDSRWKLQGPLGRGDGRTVAQLRSERSDEGES
ncbi:MAG: hypothetical protein QOE08_403 [Thermoleophilaceae bacterium]|jgi:hypothetical protein|nr:hypothetical protein [Thermoleophilaceae bacterium]